MGVCFRSLGHHRLWQRSEQEGTSSLSTLVQPGISRQLCGRGHGEGAGLGRHADR
jgi:hypothetical protein